MSENSDNRKVYTVHVTVEVQVLAEDSQHAAQLARSFARNVSSAKDYESCNGAAILHNVRIEEIREK